MKKAPTTLIIADGLGLRDEYEGNAFKTANTPELDQLFAECASTSLVASGPDVGLPEDQMGNSEVGHTNIGGGRVVFQDLLRIDRAIEDGTFFENEAYNTAMDACLEQGSSLHLMGLLSDVGIHARPEHLYALLKMASIKGLKRVYIHCFLDGHDSTGKPGREFVSDVVRKCASLGVGKVATIMGRYYAMDSGGHWDRIETAYDALVYGEGVQISDPVHAVAESYRDGISDEFLEPVVCDRYGTISDHDSVIFFNFRPDYTRELTRAFTDPNFTAFNRERFPLTFVCNSEYAGAAGSALIAFPRERVSNCLGEYLSRMGMTQLRISTAETGPQVTYFLDCGYDLLYEGEDCILIPAPKESPAERPEAGAWELTEACVERIVSGVYDFIVLNLSNCEAAGHTGSFDAAVRAVEVTDACIGKIVQTTLRMGGIALVTSGYGNVEQMTREDGKPTPSNTQNPVPFIICGAATELRPGRLADVAPTILDVMGLAPPEEMQGHTLIVK